MELKEYIDLVYDNFKDKGCFDDFTNSELTTMLLMESKNLINGVLCENHKRNKTLQNEGIKKLFKNIGILVKINNIDLLE